MNDDGGMNRTIPAVLEAALDELAVATPGSLLMDEINVIVRNAASTGDGASARPMIT